MTAAIEQLAKDLLIDIRAGNLREIVIGFDSRLESLSDLDFEELKSRLKEMAPEVQVVRGARS